MNLLIFLEWGGSITGMTGAGLLATNSTFSGWGFVVFLVSNFLWIGYVIKKQAHGLLLMQFGFTATSVIGVYRWFFI